MSKIFDYAILNGKLLSIDQPQISIFDDAMFSSFGVYETVKVDRGRPFYLKEHLRRLFKSARVIELKLEADPNMLATWFNKLTAVDPKATWVLKIIALGTTKPTATSVIAMQPVPLNTYPDTLYQNGASAILYKGQRVLPACKSLNTLVNFLARREATRAGALEGLLHHNNNLTEGARTNLFAVQNGQLVTPPASEVLSGITRDVILNVMRETKYPAIETFLSIELLLYEEVFITSTSMHVMPITQINNQPIGDGRVGPITKLVMNQFEAHYHQVILNNDN